MQERNMKRFFGAVIILFLLLGLSGCEEWSRSMKDFSSSISGLERTVSVYSDSGELLRTYEGRIDIESTEYGNKVKFDIDGKRTIIYNAVVIVEEM
jgi:uncharacterized lipoprotein YehR (DUF1307 family)